MRTFVSCTAITVAALGLVGGTLIASPASAEDARGMTRAQILEAANTARKTDKAPDDWGSLERFTMQACGVPQDDPTISINKPYQYVTPVAAGQSADGVLATTQILYYDDPESPFASRWRTCNVALLTTTDPARQLSGSVEIRTPNIPDATFPLGGKIFVSPVLGEIQGLGRPTFASLEANGEARLDIKKIAIPRTAAHKKTARASYDRSVKAAKKSYVKAKKKANKATSKKARATARIKAKKLYTAKRTTAKKRYVAAIAPTYKWGPGIGSPRAYDRKPFRLYTSLSAL